MAPLKNRITYPVLIRERARTDPSKAYAIIPKTDSLEDGYRELTYGMLARAMNKASWWLDREIGVNSFECDTFGYIGANDHRYTFLYLAAYNTKRQVWLQLVSICSYF